MNYINRLGGSDFDVGTNEQHAQIASLSGAYSSEDRGQDIERDDDDLQDGMRLWRRQRTLMKQLSLERIQEASWGQQTDDQKTAGFADNDKNRSPSRNPGADEKLGAALEMAACVQPLSSLKPRDALDTVYPASSRRKKKTRTVHFSADAPAPAETNDGEHEEPKRQSWQPPDPSFCSSVVVLRECHEHTNR
jgi:hypothetical protein